MLFFADRSERAVVQGMLIGSVVSVMAALMLLLNGLDSPFHDGVGGLQPVAMERSLRIIDEALGSVGVAGAAPVRRAREGGGVVTSADAGRSRVELVATVLLAVATVATAWSGYQSTRWNGEQAKAGGRANALRIESAKAAGLANTQSGIDVATFTQWANAYSLRQTELADFYFKRFRPGVQARRRRMGRDQAAQEPGRAPDAVRDAAVPARGTRAGRPAREPRRTPPPRRWSAYIQRSSNYVLGVVLFASALFFAGISTKLTSPQAARRAARDRLRDLPPHRRLDRDLARQRVRVSMHFHPDGMT